MRCSLWIVIPHSYEQAYDRYIKEAESAGEGLSSDWIDKIQNGKIDIETITDSDLKEKISDYKNW